MDLDRNSGRRDTLVYREKPKLCIFIARLVSYSALIRENNASAKTAF